MRFIVISCLSCFVISHHLLTHPTTLPHGWLAARFTAAQVLLTEKVAEVEGLKIHAMGEQLVEFKSRLQDFALKHKKAVTKDPDFRRGECARRCVVCLSFWCT
jgi:hypothetical protein